MWWAHLFALIKCSVAGTNRHAEAACWGRAREPGAGQESWALPAAWGRYCFSEFLEVGGGGGNLSIKEAFRERLSRSSQASRKCPKPPQGAGRKPNTGQYLKALAALPKAIFDRILYMYWVLRKSVLKGVKTTRVANLYSLYLQEGKMSIFFHGQTWKRMGSRSHLPGFSPHLLGLELCDLGQVS